MRTTNRAIAVGGQSPFTLLVFRFAVMLFALLTFSSGAQAAWYDANWQYRKLLTIDHTRVTGALTNFPVLISLSADTDLATYAQANGNDILFASSDGTTKLDHEIERYSSGTLVAWVRVPSLSSTADTSIYIYYGYASAANQQNPTGVWGTNYNAVYHLPNGTTLSANDSTSNARNGTINGATATAGIVDGAANFNGSTYYIRVPTGTIPSNNNFVVSAWFKTTSNGTIFGEQNSAITGTPSQWDPALYVETNGLLHGGIYTGNIPALQSSGAVNDGAWHQAVLVVNTTGTTQTLYLDGVSVGNATGTPEGPFSYVYIGTGYSRTWTNAANGNYYFNGTIDEVRISSSATTPSATWISTEYNNQNWPNKAQDGANGFITVESETETGFDLRQVHYRWRNDDGAEQGSANWWNTNYGYRKKVTFGTSHSLLPLGYTVSVPMDTRTYPTTDVMLASGNDVRIVWQPTSGGYQELDRIGDTWNSATTHIEFRLQSQIAANLNEPSDGSYYIYYGYASAGTPPTNEMNVYYFADLFNRANNTTVGNGWTETESGGTAFIYGNTLHQNGNNVGPPDVVVKQNFPLGAIINDCTLTFDWTIPSNSEGSWTTYLNIGNNMPDNNRTTNVAFGLYAGEGNGLTGTEAVDDNMLGALENNINGTHSFKLVVNNSSKTFDYYRDGTLRSPSVAFLGSGTTLSQIRMANDQYASGQPDFVWDNLKIVLNVASTPATVAGAEEAYVATGATWAAAEDSKLLGLNKEVTKRLRFEISNKGAVSTGAVTYQLQVAQTSTCGSGTYSAVPTDTSGAWQIVDSTYITDGQATVNVTPGLTDDGTTFVAGQSKDAGNTTGSITLGSSQFTEIEFAVQATSNALDGADYCFRLVAYTGGLSIDTYSVYGQVSIASSLSFSYRRAITIDHTKVICGSMTDFPLLVSITEDSLKVAPGGHVTNSNGYDIIFRDSDGTTQLDHEIEQYNGATGTLVAWVRVPSLTNTAPDKVIYMYYGNSSVTSPTQNPNGVWDSNYVVVHHMNGSSYTALDDSTSNHNDITYQNGTPAYQQTGEIGYGVGFNGTNGAVEAPDSTSLDITNQVTVSAWIKPTAIGQWNRIVAKSFTSNAVPYTIYGLLFDDASHLRGEIASGGGQNGVNGSTVVPTGAWTYATFVYDHSDMRLYFNGAPDGTPFGFASNIDTDNMPLSIARSGFSGDYFNGTIDEVRVSKTARSACWIQTEYNNQFSPSTFYTVGNEVSTPPTVVDLLSFKATGSGDNVVVSWETAQELDNVGFNLYRSTVKGGPYVRITDTLIGGMTFSVKGRSYSYVDSNVTRGNLYYYKLEDIDTRGQSTMHGPVCVDWDGDGMPDDWEIAHGLNPQVDDAGLDYDGDGLTNLEEYERNTDPLNSDTNGDGIPDGEEPWGVQSVAGVTQTLGSGVETISSDETGITLELRTDAFETAVVEHDGEAYDRLSIPSYIHGWTQETGKPEMPVKGVILDIPAGKQAALQVVSVEKSTKEGYWIYPVPQRVAVEEGGVAKVQEVFTMDNDAYRQDAFYPGAVAELGETFDYRGQIKQQVLFYPLAFDPARGELEHYSRIRIKVAYEGDVDVAQKASLPILYRGVSMSGGGTTGSGSGAVVGWSPPAGGDAYKIQVSEDGIYRLTKAWLEARGVNVGAMNLSQLRMYNLGQELPIYVYDANGNNLFDPEDYIEFYGQKVPSEYSKYTKYNVHWLVTAGGDGTPKRMAVEEGSPGAGAIALTHDYTLRDERDEYYIAQAQGDNDVDRWYFADFAEGSGSGGGPTTFTVTVPGVGGTGKGQLTVAMLGLTELGHQVEVKVNGAVVGTYTWTGFVPYDAVLGNVDLREGDNTVTLTCLTGSDSSQPDGVAVDYFEVTYPRIFAAQGDSLMFTHDTGYRYQVTGFGVNSVEAFDITSATDVKRIADGQVTGTGPFTLDMEPAGVTGERTYEAVTANSVKTPVAVVKDTASSLASTANGADWILITPRSLGWYGSGASYGWLSSLVALRQAQGLRVKVVSVEDACDEFSYGIVGPEGIKNFLSYAYANWTPPAPRYVLLVGDGTTDPKDNQELNETVPYIPTYLVYTEHAGETASDEWFVEVSGSDSVPDMDIGRLPAASEAEAEVMAGKIVSYETSANTQTWEKNVLLVADNATAEYEKVFEVTDNDVAAGIPQGMNSPFMEYLSRYGSAGALNTAIMNRINVDGSLVVNYSGHGSTQVWANENIFNVDDVTALSDGAKLPFFVAMTCLNGYFVFPESFAWPSLAEALMRGSGKGAVGILASTGMTAPEGQRILDEALFEALFKDDLRTLGPAISKARQELLANGSGYEEVSETFQLFGDPAMVLKVPLPRVPGGVSVSVNSGMVQLSWSKTQDCNGGAVAGYNLYRGVTPGGPYEKVNTALITGTEYSDSGATSGTWYYVVTSVDGSGLESVKSVEVMVTAGARSVGGTGSGGGGGGCFISTIAN